MMRNIIVKHKVKLLIVSALTYFLHTTFVPDPKIVISHVSDDSCIAQVYDFKWINLARPYAVLFRPINYDIQTEHKNIECLIKKGYDVKQIKYNYVDQQKRQVPFSSDRKKNKYVDLLKITKNTMETFEDDCKECDVETILTFKKLFKTKQSYKWTDGRII